MKYYFHVVIFLIAINDSDEDISCIAISGLWEYEHRDLIKILINKIRYDQSNKVKNASIVALGRFAALAEEKKLVEHDNKIIKNVLFEIIKDESIPDETKIALLVSAALAIAIVVIDRASYSSGCSGSCSSSCSCDCSYDCSYDCCSCSWFCSV